MNSFLIRFSLLMFLQFFIWGVWYVPMWSYLGTLGIEASLRGTAYAATGVAAMISPFIVGMIADRFFATQKVYGFLHILGGVFLYLCGQASGWDEFYLFLLLHLLFLAFFGGLFLLLLFLLCFGRLRWPVCFNPVCLH